MYIGNYKMQSEPNEFHCYDGFSGYAYCYYEFVQDYLIDKYEQYNLKKEMFTPRKAITELIIIILNY